MGRFGWTVISLVIVIGMSLIGWTANKVSALDHSMTRLLVQMETLADEQAHLRDRLGKVEAFLLQVQREDPHRVR